MSEGRIRPEGFYIGIVKANKDAQRMGRLSVAIPELGSSLDKQETWFLVGYASPYAGATQLSKNKKRKEFADTNIIWLLGIATRFRQPSIMHIRQWGYFTGYWFACLYQWGMNHMVPAVGIGISTKESENKETLPPVAEYNKNDESEAKTRMT